MKVVILAGGYGTNGVPKYPNLWLKYQINQ